jgi:hypothetical protein
MELVPTMVLVPDSASGLKEKAQFNKQIVVELLYKMNY